MLPFNHVPEIFDESSFNFFNQGNNVERGTAQLAIFSAVK